MSDLKLPAHTGISSFAVSEPFPFFSPDAVQQMRAEVLSKDVWNNCKYSSNLANSQLRGFAAEYAPFVFGAWKNKETLAIVSRIAGIDLVPGMDFEIAHINLSTKSDGQKNAELATAALKLAAASLRLAVSTLEPGSAHDLAVATEDSASTLNLAAAGLERQSTEVDEGIALKDSKPIVGWHTDSYPFVCVTMLSDCTDMVGGETALRTGDGTIMKVRGPQMGWSVILQGRYIEHQALRALGIGERMTMVTSFRPRDPMVRDDTVLTTVRGVSDLSQLYFQYSEYRMEMLQERIRLQLVKTRANMHSGKIFDTALHKVFLQEQSDFLSDTNREIIQDNLVIKGIIDGSHLSKGRLS